MEKSLFDKYGGFSTVSKIVLTLYDRLLEDDEIEIAGISGTSAGALNGAALKAGMIEGGREGARANLDWFRLREQELEGEADEALREDVRLRLLEDEQQGDPRQKSASCDG